MTQADAPRPVFPLFVGSGRSGTTLIRAVFNSHRDLAVAMEGNFLVSLLKNRDSLERDGSLDVDRAIEVIGRSPGLKKMQMDRDMVEDAVRGASPATVPGAGRAVFAAYADLHGKPLYGDKTPGYVKHIGMLGRGFPEAKFVHIIRDGRDTAAAYLSRGFGPESVGEAATNWKRNVDKGRSSGRALGPDRYAEVRYEDLLDDFETEVTRLSDFLGLSPDPAVLRYWQQSDDVLANQPVADRHVSASKPPTKGMRDWRKELSDHQIGVFEAIAGDTLRAAGYELTGRISLRARMTASRDWLAWQRKALRARMSR